MKEAKVGMKEMREITEFTVCNNTRWGIFTNKSGRDSVRWSLMFYLAEGTFNITIVYSSTQSLSNPVNLEKHATYIEHVIQSVKLHCY